MTIQKITQNFNNLSSRILRNKTFLKGLEKISEHGISFSAGTSLILASVIRPVSIFATPNVEKENKQYAAASSISSGLVKFGIVEAIALPIENAVKRIDKNPKKYLNSETIKNLAGEGKLANSRSYKLITQLVKLSTGLVTAIPKSIITLALIPILMDKTFFRNKKQKEQKNVTPLQKEVNFTGNIGDKISKGIGKIVDNQSVQKFAKKHATHDEDIAKHVIALTDIMLTASYAHQTNKSTKIKENRKKALIYNNVISTAITLFGGYGLDKLIKNRTGNFIEKFKQINAGNPKLPKYIEGLNILRPTIIFAAIYYGILPIFSTYMAEKIDRYVNKSKM